MPIEGEKQKEFRQRHLLSPTHRSLINVHFFVSKIRHLFERVD